MTPASKSLTEHLLRGLLGFTALVGAVGVMTQGSAWSVLLAVAGVDLLRGCPTCWRIGLTETLEAYAVDLRMNRAVAPLLLGCLCAAGCATRANPVSVHGTDNAQVPVEHLFTHDGCAVYRFRDIGYHYYVRCDGAGSAMTHSLESCGKSCFRDETIPTFEATPAPTARASATPHP